MGWDGMGGTVLWGYLSVWVWVCMDGLEGGITEAWVGMGMEWVRGAWGDPFPRRRTGQDNKNGCERHTHTHTASVHFGIFFCLQRAQKKRENI